MAHYQQEKEQGTDRCCNPGEPQKHYAKWKKPATKDCILYDSIYMKFSDRKIYKTEKSQSHYWRVGKEGTEWGKTDTPQQVQGLLLVRMIFWSLLW